MRGGSQGHLQGNLTRKDAHRRTKMDYTRDMRALDMRALDTYTTRACTKNRTCLTSIRRDVVAKKARLQDSAGEKSSVSLITRFPQGPVACFEIISYQSFVV